MHIARQRIVPPLVLAVLVTLVECVPEASQVPAAPATTAVSATSLDASGVVFAADAPVWAHRSTIHVGEATYDLAPHRVEALTWTPFALYLGLGDATGQYGYGRFDGREVTPIEGVRSEIIGSADGRWVAWIDANGPERPAGRVARLVVQDARTGALVHTDSEGMGGAEGDDLGDRYEELPPAVLGFEGDVLLWQDAAGSGRVVRTNLATGASSRSGDDPGLANPTSGIEFASPDGRYRVDASRPGALVVTPRQPQFGHAFQFQGGWLGNDLLVLAQDEFEDSYDATVPDTTVGFILRCTLDSGACTEVAHVVGARDVVFAGVTYS